MKEIRGDAKSVRALLGGSKFSIDYYQREYRWEKKQVIELLNDLSSKFLESHETGNERSAVENYGHYFLGSIIISDKEGRKFIIDGQQRLTTITLLLIYIYQHLEDDEQKKEIANLIFSYRVGKRSFNLDVDERTACMDALFTGQAFDENGKSESVVNVVSRYNDIDGFFPDELSGDELPFFADWFIENVHMVEITAYSDSDAYTIFETMNDRGLSLTPTDMLKGYLLANITDPDRRMKASEVWRKQVSDFKDIGKDEDADAIKSWLRSQHANTIRERKRGALPRDFDLIGTEFHRWVRENEEKLKLTKSVAFGRFIEEDFAFYTRWYKTIREAAEHLTPELETIHFNAQNNFTLQYPVLLAPLTQGDTEREIYKKLRIVSSYLDILIARRIWNWKSTSYSAMQYTMFQLAILKIRGKSVPELASILYQRLEDEEENFASNAGFSLHGMNRPPVHRILARITDFIETGSGRQSRYAEYMMGGKQGYEVEHIWANHPERHTDEFSHPTEFTEYRNRIGGLLLLPKSFNASYGDKRYSVKREQYFGQNLLAQSLHEKAYKHDPGFARFLEETKLPFKYHTEFKKSDLDERQSLYCLIAEQIWNPENLLSEVDE